MERTIPFLNGCISFVAFITALALVVYMLMAFVTGMFDVAMVMFDTVFLDSAERQEVVQVLNADFLHNVAILLILMKAYRILVEYMRHHHIDIRYMIEIGIIACILELLFNSEKYTETMQWVLALMAVAFLVMYSFRYDTLTQATKDAAQQYKDAKNESLAEKEAAKQAKLDAKVAKTAVATTKKPAAKPRAKAKPKPKAKKKE